MKALANLEWLMSEDLAAGEAVLEKINRLKPAPLMRLEPDDVWVRAMRLTGNKLNSYFGRFRDDDLPTLAKLSVGAPVLIGHNKSERPVGRIFDSRVEGDFVVTPFFVPTARSDASDLIADIDTGVASECSISFQCEGITCGTCGKDMRKSECPHYPGRDGAFYFYENITMVLEGSIVYRGAHPDTGFIRQSLAAVDGDWEALFTAKGHVKADAEAESELGRNLGRFLSQAINRRVSSNRSREAIIGAIADDSGDSPSMIRSILRGEVRCPDRPCLRSFAKVLRISLSSITRAGEADGCNYSRRTVLVGGKTVEREVC